MSDETQYLTVAQAAARLQTSDEMVRRMLRDGRLRGTRLGGRKVGWRLAASEIDRILTPDPRPRPGPRPARDRSVLIANLLDQAERVRARGETERAAQIERMAAEAAEA